jgi:hypothetical protein
MSTILKKQPAIHIEMLRKRADASLAHLALPAQHHGCG